MGTNEKNAKLWENIQAYAKKVGRVAAKPALQLYYVMTAEGTSRGTKILIGSALAYTILPINLISKEDHPILGRADEAAALLIVYNKVKKNITPEIEQKTEETLDKWFAEEGNDAQPTADGEPSAEV